jgi:hypothetical protein
MPEVVVGWCARCWACWGGDLGGKLYILGVAGFNTPIWDVLVPEGEQEVLNHLRMCSRCPVFQIRQVVPVGLARGQFCCWARWASFSMKKNMYYSIYSVFTYNILFSKCLGRWKWMDGSGWIWMTFNASLSYLRSHIDYSIYS